MVRRASEPVAFRPFAGVGGFAEPSPPLQTRSWTAGRLGRRHQVQVAKERHVYTITYTNVYFSARGCKGRTWPLELSDAVSRFGVRRLVATFYS